MSGFERSRKESRKGCVGLMGKGRNYWSKPRPNADSLERSVIGVDLYNQNITGDVSKTLSAIASDADHVPCIILDARGNGNGEISPTLTGDHQNRITDYTAIVVEVRNESDRTGSIQHKRNRECCENDDIREK